LKKLLLSAQQPHEDTGREHRKRSVCYCLRAGRHQPLRGRVGGQSTLDSQHVQRLVTSSAQATYALRVLCTRAFNRLNN